jgi:ABC-type transporter Mla MlaB component
MALFSKPPAKKSGASVPPPKAGPGKGRPSTVTAREVAASARQSRPGDKPKFEPVGGDISVTGASIIEWAPAQPSIEVAQANPGLCAVLENAALLYASGQAAGARTLLEQGVQTDHDAKLSPLAWLALFDLLQRAGDRAAFDKFALQYVVQFERSPPAWDESVKRTAPAGGPRAVTGGYLALNGTLTAASAQQIDGLRKAVAKKVAQARLDLASVAGFDDAGARLLASALAEARHKGIALTLQRPEKLRVALQAAVRKGRDGGEGAWLLMLELIQWGREQEAFDDMAINYAVTFEMSPPSWDPPPPTDGVEAAEAAAPATDSQPEVLAWHDVLAGSATSFVAQLAQFAQSRSIVALDLTDVERVDFVCAGALLNAIDRIESQRKAVQILGASPIVRALLLLIGISPRHFVRKPT